MKYLKNHKILFILLFTLCCFLACGYCYSQDKEKLKKEKEKLQQEINYTNDLIKQTKKNKQMSLNHLVLLNRQIEKRKELINTIQQEITQTENDIEYNKHDVQNLNTQLASLKNEYSRMVYAAFKNRSFYNRLMFIFSADDFNQAYRRLKYLQQFNNNLKKQAELIQITQNKVNNKISELNNYMADKETLKNNNESEKQQLVTEKKQQGQSIKELENKQSQLQQTVKEKQKAAAALQHQIEDIIAKEIAESNKKKVVKTVTPDKTKTEPAKPKPDVFYLTPEEQKLSNSFSANKGRLPWPTAKGIVSNGFGEHAHPVLKFVKTKNNGIDISTENNSQARAIFDGKVTAVISVPGADNAIIIRHGDYLSVYSNIQQVFVKKGDNITTKQAIGKITTDPSDFKTELHFELWHGKTILNPLDWLAR